MMFEEVSIGDKVRMRGAVGSLWKKGDLATVESKISSNQVSGQNAFVLCMDHTGDRYVVHRWAFTKIQYSLAEDVDFDSII